MQFFTGITSTAILLLILPHKVLNTEIDCTSLIPSGSFSSQQDDCPFQINVFPDKYYPNEETEFVRVNVSRKSFASLRKLKGIILQARKNDAVSENYIVGYFLSTGHGTDGKTCPTKSNEDLSDINAPNTIVHEDISVEIDLPFEVVWNTHENWGPIVFVATFITDESKYWSGVTSQVLSVGETTTQPCWGKRCAEGTCIEYWKSCPEDACPVSGEYRCHGGECIASSKRCDGVPDCITQEDEECCDGFQCVADKKCIPLSHVCDVFHDCLTADDEQDCSLPSTSPPCLESEFHCGDDECIPSSLLCDGKDDCHFGTDERAEQCGSTTQSPGVSVSVIAGAVVGVIVLIVLLGAVFVFIFRRHSQKVQKRANSTPQTTQNVSSTPSTGQTSGLTVGVYPGTNAVRSSQPYLAGIGAGYVNQGFETSPGQSHLRNQSFPVNVQLGATNMGFMEDQPPSYEQAINSVPGQKSSQGRVAGVTPPQFSYVPSTSVTKGQEDAQNEKNSAYEKALEDSKNSKKRLQYHPNISNPIANTSVSTSYHRETEI